MKKLVLILVVSIPALVWAISSSGQTNSFLRGDGTFPSGPTNIGFFPDNKRVEYRVHFSGVDLKRFAQLAREFSVQPPEWREATSWSEYQKRIQNAGPLYETIPRMPVPPLPPENNETPEGLRARANTLELMLKTQAIAQAQAKRVCEERQVRWKEYQEMLSKIEEATK